MLASRSTLLSFVDYQDPYARGLIAEEPIPGPIIAVLNDRPFERVHLLYTPHTTLNAQQTDAAIRQRWPHIVVRATRLEIFDPKSYTEVMRSLQFILEEFGGERFTICASSGTAEMRAAWFILANSGMVEAEMLRVDAARPSKGLPARVRQEPAGPRAWAGGGLILHRRREARALTEMPLAAAAAAPPDVLEVALAELRLHVESEAMRHVVRDLKRLARFSEPLLLTGATGTGKTALARLVHRLSPRAGGPFIDINCANLPHELAESLLFGHVKGAFTGAADQTGYCTQAEGGTLMLDEIGEMPYHLQAKLLKFLDDRVVQPLHGPPRKVDVRVIAATNRPLYEMVARKKFHLDLYYRLASPEIVIPSLAERRDDVPGLAMHFLEQINQTLGHSPRSLTKGALERLSRHQWPGNVRELMSVIKSSVMLSRKHVLHSDDLLITGGPASPDPYASLPDPAPGFKLEEFLSRVRKHLYLRALEKTGGSQQGAAELLGVTKAAVNLFVKNNNASAKSE